MIYSSKNKSIIKIEGTVEEVKSDLYNIARGLIRSGIKGSEIAKIILAADLEVEEEWGYKRNDHRAD